MTMFSMTTALVIYLWFRVSSPRLPLSTTKSRTPGVDESSSQLTQFTAAVRAKLKLLMTMLLIRDILLYAIGS